MNITEDKQREVHYHTRTIDFEGAEPILLERRYSHGGKLFVPDHTFAKWEHGEPITDIRVTGYVLKKDGTPGQNRAEFDYATPANRHFGRTFCNATAPEWLLELFADSPHTTTPEPFDWNALTDGAK